MLTTHDTIVAPATAAGPAVRGIVRTSGPQALALARSLGVSGLPPRLWTPARLRVSRLPPVPARVLAFHGPASHTGEDVVEYHVPGNPLLVALLMSALIDAGARPAEPGEFSARAYLNGKTRLESAEGVAAAIAADSDATLAAAGRLRAGELSRYLAPLTDATADLLARCELAIDFTEEDVTVVTPEEVGEAVADVRARLNGLLAGAARLEQTVRPPRVVLAGYPNAGKSTLMNALLGRERVITSPVAGTTRDTIEADLDLPRGRVTLVDAAGLEAQPTDAGTVADAMRQAAWRAAGTADVLVLVTAADDARDPPPLPRPADLQIRTKTDLGPEIPGFLGVCAPDGDGIEELRASLDAACWEAPQPTVTLAARHVAGVERAVYSLTDAGSAAAGGEGFELVAFHLREALDALGEVTGVITPDDLLGRIFAGFCIGK